MDPVGQRASTTSVLLSLKGSYEDFARRLQDLCRIGKPGEILNLSIAPALLLRALSPSGAHIGPLKLFIAIPSEQLVAVLSCLPTSQADLSIHREPDALSWNFRGWIRVASPLLHEGQTEISLHEPGVPSPVPPPGQPGERSILRGLSPEGTSVRAEHVLPGPVVVYPAQPQCPVVGLSVGWLAQDDENPVGGGKRSENDEFSVRRFSFSLDIPWALPGGEGCPSDHSGAGPGTGEGTTIVRIVGVFDRSAGSITLHSQDAPESFRSHFNRLVPSLARDLGVYPGVELRTTLVLSGPLSGHGESA